MGRSGRQRESPTVRRPASNAQLREGEEHFGKCERAREHSRKSAKLSLRERINTSRRPDFADPAVEGDAERTANRGRIAEQQHAALAFGIACSAQRRQWALRGAAEN
jgi:hypothetical protein